MQYLKILGQKYKIKYFKGEERNEGEYGSVSYIKSTIYLNDQLCKEETEKTLLHEILHVLDHSVRIGLTEKQIDAVANCLHAVFSDNQVNLQVVIPSPKIRFPSE